MDKRLARYLIQRLRRTLERDAIAEAIDADLLSADTDDGEPVRAFAPGPAVAGRSLPEVAAMLRRQRFSGTANPGEYEIDSDPFESSFVMFFPADEMATPERDSTTPSSNPAFATRDLVALVRRSAQAPRAADVAAVLLLAQGVERSRIDVPELLRILSLPAPVVAITATVKGFEEKLLSLLARGMILHRPVRTVNGYQFFQPGRQSFASDPDVPCISVFAGEDFDEKDAPRQKVGYAACAGDPILGLAEEAANLPPILEKTAQLVVHCGPLTPEIICLVVETVLGECPQESGPACDCSQLDLADLALAIRPGTTSARAIRLLQELAETKQSSGAASSSGKSAKETGSTSRRGRDQTTGSTVIQPQVTGAEGSSKITPARVETLSGYGEARDWALALKDDLKLWRAGKLEWSEMSTKLLLVGPPGTGKTTYAKAVCNTLQVPLVATSVATWLEPGYLGDVVARMKRAFAEAEAHSPCILFIDEFDGIGSRGRAREYDDYWTTIVNRLLELLDGAAKTTGVIVIGATNNPANIDPALLRSGRLEKHIPIPLPDTGALMGIFRHHLKEDLHSIVASAPIDFGTQGVAPVRSDGEGATEKSATHGEKPR